LDRLPFKRLSEEENNGLVLPFPLHEIEKVVKESDENKSLVPDGFNFAFIHEFWYLMKGRVRIMFDQFYGNSVLHRSFWSNFIVLIPKVDEPFALKDYRLITLVGCLYKLISKVLGAHLAMVLNSVISTSQSTFLKGRDLVNGVIVINEVVDGDFKVGRNEMEILHL